MFTFVSTSASIHRDYVSVPAVDAGNGMQMSEQMNGKRSGASVMYQTFLAASQRAPSALTASFSAKGVTRSILMWPIIDSDGNMLRLQVECHAATMSGMDAHPAITQSLPLFYRLADYATINLVDDAAILALMFC